MKLISTNTGTQEFKFGDKVFVVNDGKFDDVTAGQAGIVTGEMDYDGEIKVHTVDDYDYFSPEDLNLVGAQKTFTVEVTAAELTVIYTVLGNHTPQEVKELLAEESEEPINEVTAKNLYVTAKQIVKEAA